MHTIPPQLRTADEGAFSYLERQIRQVFYDRMSSVGSITMHAALPPLGHDGSGQVSPHPWNMCPRRRLDPGSE